MVKNKQKNFQKSLVINKNLCNRDDTISLRKV